MSAADRRERIADARQYLETGGLGETIGLTSVYLDMGWPKVQLDTDMAMALLLMAAELADMKARPS